MIAIDTNVLLRLMIADDADQAGRAKALFDKAIAAGEEILVAPVVLVEFVWALRKAYKHSRSEVADHLERLASVPFIRIPDREMVLTAIVDYRRGPADFADHLIAAYAEAQGASPVYTFDEGAVRTGRFAAVP